MGSVEGFSQAAVGWLFQPVLGLETKTWAVAIMGLAVLWFLMGKATSSRGAKLPPGPRNLPLVGALFSLESNKAHCFTKLAKKYGPIFYFRLGSYNVIVVSSPEGAEEVLKTKDAIFANRPTTTIMRMAAKYVGFEGQDIVHSNYNNHLKILRKLCLADFFAGAKLSSFEHVRRHEGSIMVEQIGRQVKEEGSGNRINVRDALFLMSTNYLAILIFGRRYSDATNSGTDEVRNFPDILKRFEDIFLKPNVVDLFPSLEWLDPQGLKKFYQEFQRICRKCYNQAIQEHKQARNVVPSYEDKDLVDVLLALQESDKITEDAIIGCISNVVGGGIDAASTTTEWALIELVRNPETLAKLQEEIDTVVGKDRQVEEADYAKLPYLEAVVRETFRLHSIVPVLIPRSNTAPTTLGGFDVPANTTVFVNLYATARDPRLWEDPFKFKPERFLGTSQHSDITNISGVLMPFGSGRRMCVGYKLGQLMFRRMLTTVVHAFDWKPPPGLGIQDISTAEGTGTLVSPVVPLVLTAKPRLAPSVYSTA